jgi:hypothetical protein
MAPEADNAHDETTDDQPGGMLMPFQWGIVHGIQAFRRGEAILYTVRGEPKRVQELISQLDAEGVDEVIAVISHDARGQPAGQDALPPQDPEQDTRPPEQ